VSACLRKRKYPLLTILLHLLALPLLSLLLPALILPFVDGLVDGICLLLLLVVGVLVSEQSAITVTLIHILLLLQPAVFLG